MDKLDEIEAAAKALNAEDWCRDWMVMAMRHLQKNCDLDCTVHDYNNPDAICNRPGRYDGEKIVDVLAAAPAMLKRLRAAEAVIAASADAYYRERTGEEMRAYYDAVDAHEATKT